MSSRLRIIVGGMVGQFPLGGVAWDYFHYVLALRELGHDVYYHEDTNTWPYNPSIREPSADGVYNANFIKAFFEKHAPELADKWHYRLLQDKCFGMSKAAFDDVARTADVYLNVSGVCILPDSLSPKCKRVFLDSDPGYNQMGLQDLLDAEGPTAKRYVEVAKEHDVHLTYAENIHHPDCQLPHCGINWITTRPVVTLPHWRDAMNTPLAPGAAYTTVMTLDLSKAPKRLHYRGVDYFDKRPEFEKFIALPTRVPNVPLMLAIGNNNDATMTPLRENKWIVVDAHDASLTPEAYRDFIGASAGEWSIAKNVYAATNSGWFSCRTCCYLAAGRPAVVQDTTWSRYVPSGAGIFAFRTMDEAIAGLERVASDPANEQRAAYDLAREYLAPDRVITKMLNDIFSSPPLEGGVRGRGSSAEPSDQRASRQPPLDPPPQGGRELAPPPLEGGARGRGSSAEPGDLRASSYPPPYPPPPRGRAYRKYTSRVDTARRLRRDMTGPEKKLWSELRGNKLGVRFRRQQPVGPYVVDFFCAAHNLVIELDGDSHLTTTERDHDREVYLVQQGYRVMRFANDEVLRDVESVVRTILASIEPPPSPPSPSRGEGE